MQKPSEEDHLHPALESALTRKLEEVHLPNHVIKWIEGQDCMFDDLELVELAFRYSPQAMRGLTLALVNGVFTEDGYFGPPNGQFRYAVANYAYFNDFISQEELKSLLEGRTIRGNLPENSSQLWTDPYDRRLHSKVITTIEEVAGILDRERKRNSDKKVIFFHGKFNCIPHAGHFLLIREALNEINIEEQILHDNMIVLVACDTNESIRAAGHRPFLNTAWRMSLMSYLPWTDYICSSGSFSDIAQADLHWAYKYNILRPDYISFESDDPLLDSKIARAVEAGITVLVHYRESYKPSQPGNPTLSKWPGAELSTSNLMKGIVDEWPFVNAYNHLNTVKYIRDQAYGKRKWFDQ